MARTTKRPGENGFPVAYCSDIDGVRFVIVDPADADMSGWSVEVATSYGKKRSEFTRDQTFYGGDGGAWWGLGYGPPSRPWSAVVNHGDRITAWIPPRRTAESEPWTKTDLRSGRTRSQRSRRWFSPT